MPQPCVSDCRSVALRPFIAVPGNVMSLADYQGFLHKIPQQLQGKVKEVSNHTLVAKRHLATPPSNVFANGDKDASVANQYYDEACYSLFVQAALGALAESNVSPHEITAIVSISCTGVAMPALTARLIEHLGFNPYVKHVPVSQWGCAGGVAALKLADLFCRANPHETVLVLCSEVCSSMYHGEMDMASMVCASLFADAASGCIVLGMESPILERVGGNPVLFMERSHEYIIPQSEHWMRYSMDSRGIHFRLAKEVGASMAVAGPIVSQFLEDCGQTVNDPDLTLIAHTGGPKILRELLHLLYPSSVLESEDKIQDYTCRQLLSSEGPRVKASLDVLRNFGNIASVTIFVSLRDTLTSKQSSLAAASKSPVLVLGCGPGMGVQQLYGHIAPVHPEVAASPLTSIAVATILPPYQSKTPTFDTAVIGNSLVDKALALALRSQGKSVAVVGDAQGTQTEQDQSNDAALAALLPFGDVRSSVISLFEQSGHTVIKSDREGSVTSLADFHLLSLVACAGSGETEEAKRELFRVTAQYSATGTLHEVRAHRVVKSSESLAVLKSLIASNIKPLFAIPVAAAPSSQPQVDAPQVSSAYASLAQV